VAEGRSKEHSRCVKVSHDIVAFLAFSHAHEPELRPSRTLARDRFHGPEYHESPVQIQSIKCMTSDFQLWRSRLTSQSVVHVPDDKQPCSRPCGSSVGRHLKTLDSSSARHWTLSLRAEPNGFPTNDTANGKREMPSTAVNVLDMKHQLEVKFQPCSLLPFHRDESPWPVVTVLLPRPILATAWKRVTDQLID